MPDLSLVDWRTAGLAATTLLAITGAALVLALRLLRREPSARLARLPGRAKLRFFRLVIRHPGVPRAVKVLPFLLALYLALPFDLIPDFIPGAGLLDDLALIVLTVWLMGRWTPPSVIAELIRAAEHHARPAHPEKNAK